MPFSSDFKRTPTLLKLYTLPSVMVVLGIVFYALVYVKMQGNCNALEPLTQNVIIKQIQSTPMQTAPIQVIQPKEESKVEAQVMQYKVAVNVLNVRTKPTTKSAIKTKIYQSDIVEVLEIQDGWAKINNGWVLLEYLKVV